MNISDVCKVELFLNLYNRAKVQGKGVFQQKKTPMTIEEARAYMQAVFENTGRVYFDYVYGRVMKIDLTDNEVSTHLYNRDNGQGAAEEVLASTRKCSQCGNDFPTV